MRNFHRLTITAALALGLAACATNKAPAPAPVAEAAPPAPAPAAFVMPEGYRWSHGLGPNSEKALASTFGITSIAPNKYVWADTIPEAGDPRVIVDLKTQMAYAWKGDVLVGAASVSSGSKGHETQLGFWPIIEKKKSHFSRKYDDAPMPYFQRMDRFGIGLHGGHNPGYAASHGCIRLPREFARILFGFTKIGTEVVVEG